MAREAFVARYEILAKNVEEISKNPLASGPLNVALRNLYSRVELLLLDIEENRLSGMNDDVDGEFLAVMEAKFDAMKFRLNLVPIERKAHWWKWLDITFRTIGE